MTGKFNRGVYWPEAVDILVTSALQKKYYISKTFHFAKKSKILKLPLDCYKACLYGDIVEVEIVNNVVEKIITRLHHKLYSNVDLCFAIILEDTNARVKTVWINSRNDNHSTINTQNYTREVED